MKDYNKMNLYDLNRLCGLGDGRALIEWQHRWITPWPSMGGFIRVKQT